MSELAKLYDILKDLDIERNCLKRRLRQVNYRRDRLDRIASKSPDYHEVLNDNYEEEKRPPKEAQYDDIYPEIGYEEFQIYKVTSNEEIDHAIRIIEKHTRREEPQ